MVKDFTCSRAKEVEVIEYTARKPWVGQQRRDCPQGGSCRGWGGELELRGEGEEVMEHMEFCGTYAVFVVSNPLVS